MSLITGDPDDSPSACGTKHHHHGCRTSCSGRRRALIAASSAVASLLSLAVILWLTLRPSSPRFSLLAITTTATATATDPNATVVVDAAFTAHNPNVRAAALYDRLQARASYAGLQLTAALLPPFDQPQGDVVLSAALSSSPVATTVTAGGRALLRLRIEGQLRWKVAAWVSGRHTLSVDCVAVVPLQPSPPPSQLRAVVLQGSQCATTLE